MILALDAALGPCSAALVQDGRMIAERSEPGERGQSQRLAALVDTLLRGGLAPDVVAVTVGPGSFTGVRAALALAHGLALAGGARLIGVSVARALAAALPARGGRSLWVAIDNRRGRIFLDRDGDLDVSSLDALPAPFGPVAAAGDAAPELAARLAATGGDVWLTDARRPHARDVARAALALIEAGAPQGPVIPLYVNEPEARLPARPGLRA